MNESQASEVLGLPIGSSRAQIAAAFRHASFAVHPDRNRSSDAATEFARLSAARDILNALSERDIVQVAIDGNVCASHTGGRVTGSSVACIMTMRDLLLLRAGLSVTKVVRFPRRVTCVECSGRGHNGRGRLTVCTPCAMRSRSSASTDCTECGGTLECIVPPNARCSVCHGRRWSDRATVQVELTFPSLPASLDTWTVVVPRAGDIDRDVTVVMHAETEADFGDVTVRRLFGNSLFISGVVVDASTAVFGGMCSVVVDDLRLPFRLMACDDMTPNDGKSYLRTSTGEDGFGGRGDMIVDLRVRLPRPLNGERTLTLHAPTDDGRHAPVLDDVITHEELAYMLARSS